MQPSVAVPMATRTIVGWFGRDLDGPSVRTESELDAADVEPVEPEPPWDASLRIDRDDAFDDARNQAWLGRHNRLSASIRLARGTVNPDAPARVARPEGTEQVENGHPGPLNG
jgi:hypothetical protein